MALNRRVFLNFDHVQFLFRIRSQGMDRVRNAYFMRYVTPGLLSTEKGKFQNLHK